MATFISELFDKVLELKDREVITLTFATLKDLNSKKVMLFREKRKYEERMKNACNPKPIFITQNCNADFNKYCLEISSNAVNVAWIQSAVVGVKGGEQKTLGLGITEETEPETALERIERLKQEAL